MHGIVYIVILSFLPALNTFLLSGVFDSLAVLFHSFGMFEFRLRSTLLCFSFEYRISSNNHQASNKRCPLISVVPLGIHIKISTSPLINAAPPNAALVRIVTIFY